MSKNFSNYNNGFLSIYNDREIRTDFSAKKNVKSLES